MSSARVGLRALRLRAGLTQDEIVSVLRQRGVPVTQTELSLLENGLREASAERVEDIRATIELILTKRLAAVRQLLERHERTENSAL